MDRIRISAVPSGYFFAPTDERLAGPLYTAKQIEKKFSNDKEYTKPQEEDHDRDLSSVAESSISRTP